MAMASEIIELRQADRDDLGPATPGKWTVSLNEPLGLKEGDTVAVRNVYLDTEASADQKIHIADDLELTMNLGYYYQGIRDDNQNCNTIAQPTYLANNGFGFIDGETYVMCMRQSETDMTYMGAIELKSGRNNAAGDQKNPWRPKANIQGDGNGPIILFALDVSYRVKDDDQTHTTQVWLSGQGTQMPAATSRGWIYTALDDDDNLYNSSANEDDPFTEQFAYDHTKQVTANIGGTNYTANGFIITGYSAYTPAVNRGQGADSLSLQNISIANDKQYYELHFKSVGQSYFINMTIYTPNTAAATGGPYVPYNQPATLSLPAGSYTPQEMCTILNRQMQSNNTTDVTNPLLNSKFLLQVNETTFPNTTYGFFKDGDAANAFIFEDSAAINDGILIGATEVVLDYDSDKGVFFWSYLHSPIYGLQGTANTSEAVGFTQTTNLANNNLKPIAITRNSGVYFTNLSAKVVKTGQPFLNFWGSDLTADPNSTSILGFDTSKLLVPNGQQQAGPPGLANGVILPQAKLVPGVNTTSGFLALDDLATRDAAESVYWHMPEITAAAPALNASNGVTQEIRASAKSSSSNNIDFGYFLIDIASQWGAAKFVGGKGYRSDNIRAVVGRYYSQASYTTGTEADAIPYTHKGLPIVLNSFDIQILSPNKQIAPNLGTDSAVFLEVVRAPPAPPAAVAGGGAGK